LAKALSLSVVSALFVVAVVGTGVGVRAEDTCLPAPTGKAPPGSRWHYRTDPVKQTKCWYLRSQGDAAQPAVAGDGGADAAGVNGAPAAAAPTPKPPKPHQAAKPPGGAKPSAAGAQTPAQAGQSPPAQGAPQSAPAGGPPAMQGSAQGGAAQGAPPWPDPQPQGSAGGVAWPTPPAVMPSAGANAAPETGGANAATEPAGQDTSSVNGTGDAATTEAAPPPPAQTSDVSGSTILALAAAIVVIGVLMRWLLGKLFARRRRIAAERREPVWVTDEYVMPDALTRGAQRPPGRPDAERADDEVKHALRKLLRTLERSAA
jgi:hypothetical protein